MIARLGDGEVFRVLVGVEGTQRPVLALAIREVGVRRAAPIQPPRDLLKQSVWVHGLDPFIASAPPGLKANAPVREVYSDGGGHQAVTTR